MDPVFESDAMRLVQAKHGAFLYNKHDLFIGKSLESYGEWCEGEIDTLLQVVDQDDIVIDVGANIGTHAIPLAKKVGQQGGVLAIEPQRLVFQTLCGNVALNSLVNVVCVNAAAGREKGRFQVPLFDPTQPFNWAAVRADAFEQGEETEVMALDSLGFNRCKLLKIDVGGMEREVLEGARELIERCKPVLFIGAAGIDGEPELLTLLEELGYEGWWHVTRYFHAENHFGNAENVFDGYRPDACLMCFPREAQVQINGFEKAQGTDDSWVKAMDRVVSRANGAAAAE